MSETVRRGPYAKGILRRRQILHEALAAYAESDASGPSLRAIAARVGLSERGLLHYFSSRDELLVAILAERDALDRERFDPAGDIEQLSAVTHNSAQTPGLVRLFSEMAGASANPQHAAHAYFTERYARLRRIFESMLAASPEVEGSGIGHRVDPALAARILIAASDGLQQQWLLDPTIDLEADLSGLASIVTNALRVPPRA